MKAIEEYSPDTVYRLNPLYTMVKRNKRILLLELDSWFKSIQKTFHLHPWLAVLLSLFDGTRTFGEVERDFEWLLETDVNVSNKFLKDMSGLDLAYAVLIPMDAKTESPLHDYKEDDLLMPFDEVDVKSNERLDFPTDIVMLLTNRCEVDCIYCYAERGKSEPILTVDKWCSLIDEIAIHKVPCIILSGGDPMIYPGVDTIINHLVEKNIWPSVSTKSVISKDRCKKLRDSGLEQIQISLDSGVPSIADQLVASDGYFSRIMQTIKNLVDSNIGVIVKSVCTSINVATLDPLVEQLHDIGCKKYHMVSYSRTVFRHHDSLFLSSEQIERVSESVDLWKQKYISMEFRNNLSPYTPISSIEEKRLRWEKRSECSTARRGIGILPNGDIAVCDRSPTSIPDFVLGSVAHQSIGSVWQSPKLLSYLNPNKELFMGTVCYDCDEFNACHEILGRCVRDSYMAYSRFHAPDPKCPKSELFMRME